MARRRGGGYRAPGNYEPNRGKKPKARRGQRANSGGDTRDGTRDAAARKRDASNERTPSKRAPNRLPPLPPLPAPLEAQRFRADETIDRSFAELGLGANLVRSLAELGAETPFAVQAATIPDALAGHHVLGRAPTGSGKTVAFGAALVERLLQLKAEGVFPADPARPQRTRGQRAETSRRGAPGTKQQRQARVVKALILAPTRELALQIDRTVQTLARSVGLYTGQFVGGQPFEPQLHALRRGVDIAIGTPGRIQDLSNREHLDLRHVAITVIDEADHLAEYGFVEVVQRILRQTRRGGQRLLFSATLDTRVDELVAEFMPKPAIHEVLDTGADEPRLPSTLEHHVLIVLREYKDQTILELVRDGGRTIVFSRTRAYADRLTTLLTDAGVRALPLHGDLSQPRRERNLAAFAEGKVAVLVATDVAARGIHVDDVDLVLQADPPDDAKSYVHRAGRTGRTGKTGRVLTVIPRTRQKRTRELFAQLGFEPDTFEDFVPKSVK